MEDKTVETAKAIDETICELLTPCMDDYASRVWRAIRGEVFENLCEAIENIEEVGFTKGDVALAIGRVIMNYVAPEKGDTQEQEYEPQELKHMVSADGEHCPICNTELTFCGDEDDGYGQLKRYWKCPHCKAEGTALYDAQNGNNFIEHESVKMNVVKFS